MILTPSGQEILGFLQQLKQFGLVVRDVFTRSGGVISGGEFALFEGPHLLHISCHLLRNLDPYAAIPVSFDLAARQEREIVFRLGARRDAGDAGNPVNRF